MHALTILVCSLVGAHNPGSDAAFRAPLPRACFQVMLTYFRVLKRRPPPPALFPAVMEGLAKFVHLVNLDTVQDLLDLLKDLLTEVTRAQRQKCSGRVCCL